jgi:hypothetical protein
MREREREMWAAFVFVRVCYAMLRDVVHSKPLALGIGEAEL